MGEINSLSVLIGYKFFYEMYDYNYFVGGSEISVDEFSLFIECYFLDLFGFFIVG